MQKSVGKNTEIVVGDVQLRETRMAGDTGDKFTARH